ncbi:immunoglobulin domain-containing protein, partial [Salmonella sp. s54395]|uniref:immunoglobulin domain-containing protein n=1 Tax=Salmonella sp. s54395 TaxID=3159664 RepID=UPI00398069B3
MFEGVITGEPAPNISWYKNGVAVSPGVYQIVYEHPRYLLTIGEVIPEDAGVYECRAGNDYGEAVCVATLKLRGPSKPVAQYEEYSFSESTWTEE